MPVNDAKYIKEVWAENLEEEMAYLRDLVEEYPYLAMVIIIILNILLSLLKKQHDRILSFQV